MSKSEESRENIRKILKDNPELAKAFKETLDEMSRPENVDKMVKDIQKGLSVIQKLKRGDK
jgi:mRNA-degrading endonuclease RelE of RelBE toxin-antitoxin system